MSTEKLVYIETFGCQMNERDSEIMEQLLRQVDYLPTRELSRADLVVVNTCSIRAKAEQKVYSLLGRLKKIKDGKPGLIITVAGCVAQQEGERLPARMPQVDIVVGTQNIYRLPSLIKEVEAKRCSRVAVDLSPSFVIPRHLPSPPGAVVASASEKRPFKKFVTIMQGCNNFCTYCVVPHTRGREVSRDMDDILSEIQDLAGQGIKEVTLLGQNVNSYGKTSDTAGGRFPELLRKVAEIDGIQRIRFTTSHPKDLSDELMRCFVEVDKLCPSFHLPVQSGSNRVLKMMNRRYTIESYLDKVEALRKMLPEISLTTDIIVGFPGETDEDFSATMELLEQVRYHGAFSFKYSDRPLAKSTDFADKVPEDVKSARLARLQDRQDQINLELHQQHVGSCLTVMVEGRSSKTSRGQWSGRTDTNHVVNFTAEGLQAGQMVKIRIEEACLHSLRGSLAD
ncbi:MAG: tRNA (N6-isopentenyl adenosine(37)-C2)-methylthiotransferase MiaB [Deltaproteobacteria bacterium RIFOXYD12_FULL_57_12]|nr:MAG: tRNA (N6-isopentenyl adenosine(37)-C2)-methylthiotransferase MiaB [Deltaproteobacteria bacterium RIFOXYD12_FULL_57_12]